MNKTKSHSHGIFCWSELCTQNWKEGKNFYTSLFNWGYDDQAIGEGVYYTMLQKQGDDIAAMYEMPKEQVDGGVPSHWLAYIAVDNVDNCAVKAKTLGAEIIAGPHDVVNAGRMLMLKDPAGATVALWQANEHRGCKRLGELNTPYWHELATRDSKVSSDFYCSLLGWTSEIKPMEGMDYTLFLVDGQPIAGMLEMTSEWPEDISAHWMIYFAVKNCDATVNKAVSFGGEICVPATDIPEVGRFSVICDPQGAVFSVIESAMDNV
ncbi:VOC family protein [Pseudoalteromonas sp. SG45-5]|uniref:VOC family protein n=1 Tax=unclassified Pseudoalteromonas TaxID=194690 RepID=UPI0015FAB09B|nr:MULTISPECIES: VOC family protein [unclassified Pseudoalteromonas]MBB1387706.1 VOC family protein [Pseudoalteromonas sp. SG45-5]MBB1395929.1 VOC family protein [Pseudoalteromonas sp. SG44-4]MBB1449240.1 VOC family protein [Pseudoalteromonas sp. SG41-6]